MATYANAVAPVTNPNAPKSAAWVALVTPNDSADLPEVATLGLPLGISFVTAGTLHIIDEFGNNVTLPSGALIAGIIHPMRVRKVYATGTSALGIVVYG